jgi:hypothetical protein
MEHKIMHVIETYNTEEIILLLFYYIETDKEAKKILDNIEKRLSNLSFFDRIKIDFHQDLLNIQNIATLSFLKKYVVKFAELCYPELEGGFNYDDIVDHFDRVKQLRESGHYERPFIINETMTDRQNSNYWAYEILKAGYNVNRLDAKYSDLLIQFNSSENPHKDVFDFIKEFFIDSLKNGDLNFYSPNYKDFREFILIRNNEEQKIFIKNYEKQEFHKALNEGKTPDCYLSDADLCDLVMREKN